MMELSPVWNSKTVHLMVMKETNLAEIPPHKSRGRGQESAHTEQHGATRRSSTSKGLKCITDAELNSEKCSLGQLYCVQLFPKTALKISLSVPVQIQTS